ncbi:MerR family transcriptional regulator [Lachnospiraceae bacterium]|nr:MerR family transcriptional regulator [Lachnospiraceae bacterium]
MTLEDASRRYGITTEKLKFYVGKGLLSGTTADDGSFDFKEEDVIKIGQIHMFVEGGMELEDLKSYLSLSEDSAANRSEKTLILKKCRGNLLEEIHQKQQILDRIDYCIYELKR